MSKNNPPPKRSTLGEPKEREFVYLDVESTGLEKQDQIIQLGIISRTGRVLLNTLIHTKQDIHPEAQAISGITCEMLTDAPCYPALHERIVQLLDGKLIKAYNASFDIRLLQQTAKHHGLSFPNKLYSRCIMKAFAERFNYGTWLKQYEACAMLGVDISDLTLHDAADDCEITRRLDLEMQREQEKRDKARAYRASVRTRKLALVPVNRQDYPDFGMYRPKNSKTLTQLRLCDLDKFEFIGTCCNTYGDGGLLFGLKEDKKTQQSG